MKNAIASLDLILLKSSGEKFPVSVEIGVPYVISDGEDVDFARCPVSMDGLHNRLPNIAGQDTFQALTLTVAFVRNMLTYFVEDGGQIFLNDGKTKFEFGPYFTAYEH
jgi:hypothetical protein